MREVHTNLFLWSGLSSHEPKCGLHITAMLCAQCNAQVGGSNLQTEDAIGSNKDYGSLQLYIYSNEIDVV